MPPNANQPQVSKPQNGPAQQVAANQQTPKQLLVERVKSANSILVTVGNNPNIDQLASALGLSLMLTKMDKHSTSVVSGAIPSSLEFLKPGTVLRKNVDNLRDFIISLDKSKADKLRYKVEDEVVKIYITPFSDSITQQDLVFSQGDINVELVIALGVKSKSQLDNSIASHGKILHDATVVTINAGQQAGSLGSINWHEPAASSISEMLVSVSEAFQGGLLDTQISNALLTGIIAATDKFSGENTTPKVMTMSAQLMAAGADQHLIIDNLNKDAQDDLRQKFADEKTAAKQSTVPSQGTAKPPQPKPKKNDKPAAKNKKDNHHPKKKPPAPKSKSVPAPTKNHPPKTQKPVVLPNITPSSEIAQDQPDLPEIDGPSAGPQPSPSTNAADTLADLTGQSEPLIPPAPQPQVPAVELPDIGPAAIPKPSPIVSVSQVRAEPQDLVSPESGIKPTPPHLTNPLPANTPKPAPVVHPASIANSNIATGQAAPDNPLANIAPPTIDVPDFQQPQTPAPVFNETASAAAQKLSTPSVPLSTALPPNPVTVQQNNPPETLSQPIVDSSDARLNSARNSVDEALRAAENSVNEIPPNPQV